jgi:hypothetical protein
MRRLGSDSRSTVYSKTENALIELNLAQVADLREYAQAAMAGEGTIQLERNLRRREAQRTDLYRQFEQAAFSTSLAKDLADQT